MNNCDHEIDAAKTVFVSTGDSSMPGVEKWIYCKHCKMRGKEIIFEIKEADND